MQHADIGVIGLTVMGANLARNLESHGYSVAVYNRTASRTEEFMKTQGSKNFVAALNISEFVQSLASPRKILLMVKAGEPVEELIDQILPMLNDGDILIDGGNSNFLDTARRVQKVEQAGKLFVGMGVSGGEEGALHGPSLMPGGSAAAWPLLQPMMEAIAAKVGEKAEPCCSWIGMGGSGHFVKMVHNGIEYADMQLISESYAMMRDVLKMQPPEIQQTFAQWNQGPLKSYLIEITAKIFGKKDAEKEGFLVDVLSDVAGQKGTGKWTAQVALDLGVAVPTIAEAVNVRFMSSSRSERLAAAEVLKTSPEAFAGDKTQFLRAIESALYASKIVAYAQGLALMQAAAKEFSWNLNYAAIVSSWRGGCIIRAELLKLIVAAYQASEPVPNLIISPVFTSEILSRYSLWKEVVMQGVQSGLPLSGFTSALGYFEMYRTAALPTNLIQAQRDLFGAHTYQRIDKEGTFHTEWEST